MMSVIIFVFHLQPESFYDGGIGAHNREYYKDFIIEDMKVYNHEPLEKWSYGLNRTYPRFCPNFNKDFVEKVIRENLDLLQKS